MATSLTCSRTVAAPPQRTYDELFAAPLEEIFSRRRLFIPPVRETRPVSARYAEPGDARTLVLADGGTMLETLTEVDPPRGFGYTLTELTGPLRPLARRVEGRWRVEPDGAGSRVTWSWTVHPRLPAGPLALPVFGLVWPGYAARALEQVDARLTRS